jgi:NAD(P)-dependent dehydrogenase (short-subunit alcohol dehydrogenase family)
MGQLDGKIAVVTGGGTGIGFAIAERFSSEGAKVVLVGRRMERLDAAAKQIGNGAYGISADMGDEAQVLDVFESLERVDILATIAGTTHFGTIEESAPADVRELFDGRFFGQLFCCHFAIPKMPEGSQILLCSGTAAEAHLPRYAAGTALCAAVNALGEHMAVALGPKGIRVNVLSPGFIVPTAAEINLDPEETASVLGGAVQTVPMGRIGAPSEVAEAALFLVTSGYVTGQVVRVDGGWGAT